MSSSASKPIKEGEKAKQTLPEVKSSKKSVHDSLEANKSNRSDASYKVNKGDIFLFEKGTIKFEEIKDGKIQCGCCKGSFSRIVGHLTKNRDCASKIDLIEFKSQWLKFTQRKRTAKCYQKKKAENEKKFLKEKATRQKLYDQTKRTQNEEMFLKTQAKKRKKCDEKQKAENEEGFLKEHAKRQKKYVQNQKARDLKSFMKAQREWRQRCDEKQKQ